MAHPMRLGFDPHRPATSAGRWSTTFSVTPLLGLENHFGLADHARTDLTYKSERIDLSPSVATPARISP